MKSGKMNGNFRPFASKIYSTVRNTSEMVLRKSTHLNPTLDLSVVPGVVLVVAAIVFLGGCANQDDPRLDFLVETEPTAYMDVPVPEKRIDELRSDISRLEDEVADVVSKTNEIGSFHKLLAQAYLSQEMFEPALNALQQAMEIQTENPILYYFAGAAYARSAKAHIVDGQYQTYMDNAERHYEIALQIDPRYVEALYAMSVLQAFELNDPQTGWEYVQRLLAREPNHTGGSFVKAHILVQLGRLEEALEIYDRLAANAPEPMQRERARENRDRLMQELNL